MKKKYQGKGNLPNPQVLRWHKKTKGALALGMSSYSIGDQALTGLDSSDFIFRWFRQWPNPLSQLTTVDTSLGSNNEVAWALRMEGTFSHFFFLKKAWKSIENEYLYSNIWLPTIREKCNCPLFKIEGWGRLHPPSPISWVGFTTVSTAWITRQTPDVLQPLEPVVILPEWSEGDQSKESFLSAGPHFKTFFHLPNDLLNIHQALSQTQQMGQMTVGPFISARETHRFPRLTKFPVFIYFF